MKLKKIILGATIAFLSVFSLVACKSTSKELTYTDSEGNVQTQVVKATEDQEEVAKDVVALASQKYEVEKKNSVKAELSLDFSTKVTADSKTADLAANLKATVEAELPTYAEDKTEADYVNELALYAFVDASAKIPDGFTTGKIIGESQNVSLKEKTYIDSGVLYASVTDYSLDLAKLFGVEDSNEMVTTVNTLLTNIKGNLYKADVSDALALASLKFGTQVSLSNNENEIKALLQISQLEKVDVESITKILNDNGIEVNFDVNELEESISELVKKLNLTVSAVSGDLVTFSIAPVTEKGTFKAEITLDTANLNLTKVSLDLSNIISSILSNKDGSVTYDTVTCKLELNLTYNITATKLSDSEKKEAKSYTELAAALALVA